MKHITFSAENFESNGHNNGLSRALMFNKAGNNKDKYLGENGDTDCYNDQLIL